MPTKISAPLLSVNEPEAEVVEVRIGVGGKVTKGQVLCVLSTTKSNFEVEAEQDGYIHRVHVIPGEMVTVGSVLFEVDDAPPSPESTLQAPAIEKAESRRIPEDLRITHRALAMAEELGVDLEKLPRNALVTESIVRAHAVTTRHRPATEPQQQAARRQLSPKFGAHEVLIYGAGGHSHMVVDLLRMMRSLRPVGIVSDPLHGDSQLMGVDVLGAGDMLPSLHDRGLRLIVNAVASVVKPRVRADVFERLIQMGFGFPALVHPQAVVEPSARLADGAQVFGGAMIGASAEIRFGAIINSGAIVSHDCVVGESAHLTPGAVLAGAVHVGHGALIGMGAMINMSVTIGEWARIGNGALVHADVPANAVVPAGSTWPVK
jgi:sugar O-acyltransferase (sialic acid O-acetyltransferase NeuD family)